MAPQVLHQKLINLIMLMIPSLSRKRRRQIVDDPQEVEFLLQIPSMDDITRGRARIDALRPIQVEELQAETQYPRILSYWPRHHRSVCCVTGRGSID